MAHLQAEKVEQQLAILKMAGSGPGLQDAISRGLAEPALFVYGELVDVPAVQQVRHLVRVLQPVLVSVRASAFECKLCIAAERRECDFLVSVQLAGTPQQHLLDTLKLFAFGTLNDYRGALSAGVYPSLSIRSFRRAACPFQH